MSVLKKYYRQFKVFTNLPSNCHFYNIDSSSDGVSSLGEVGIKPMTTMDDLLTKNPEALLNGYAVEQLIKDCTDLKIDPKELIKADIDALLIGIKIATNGPVEKIHTVCKNEKCAKEMEYDRDLNEILDSIREYEAEYTLKLEDGLTLYLRPSIFKEYIMIENEKFQDQKKMSQIEKSLETLSTDEDNVEENEIKFISTINSILKDMTIKTIELYARNIVKIETDDPNEAPETSYDEILEWFRQIDKTTYNKIKKAIDEINDTKMKPTENVKCPNCNHEWKEDIDINVSDFFENGS